MGFPAKMLNPGEEVVVDVRPHWKYLFVPAFAVAVVVAGCIVALVEQVSQWALFALGAVLVICLVWLASRYVRWTTTTFVVTTERLVMRKGVLKRSGKEILIDRLTDISYTQSLSDRILHCGDVLLESPGRDSLKSSTTFPTPSPSRTRSTASSTRAASGQPSAAPAAGPHPRPPRAGPPNPAAKLEGALTQREQTSLAAGRWPPPRLPPKPLRARHRPPARASPSS